MFKKMDMFVYSGTGNTYNAAKCIGDTGKTKGVDYEINMIDINSRPMDYKPDNSHLLGLMAPTLGTIQPVSFFNFILKLPKGDRQKVFLASTGAWTKIGPIFIPGYVGLGLYFAALILLIKGYKIVGVTGFGMPHNWTTFIPPYWKKLENRINKEIHTTAGEFAMEILSGKRVFKRIGDLIFSLLILPLTLLFIILGHLFLAKTMFAGSSCNGCGICAANCPRKAIKMYGKKQKQPYWSYKCEQCMRCAGYCPKKAVESNTFIWVTFIMVFYVLHIDTIVINYLSSLYDFAALPLYIVIDYLIYYILFLLFDFAIYALFYLLNRIPVISKVFTFMSFTHYWRKYRHHDVNVGTLKVK